MVRLNTTTYMKHFINHEGVILLDSVPSDDAAVLCAICAQAGLRCSPVDGRPGTVVELMFLLILRDAIGR